MKINSNYVKSLPYQEELDLASPNLSQFKSKFYVSRTNLITKNDGFTIIELIVTILVLGIMIFSITSLLVGIQKSQHSSLLLESASRAGEQEIESLRNNNYSSLAPGSSINFTGELPNILPSPKSGLANVSQPVDGLRRVDVIITYTDGTKTKTVSLSSLIGQIGIGQ